MIPISHGAVSVYTIPTDGPESDGTLEWTSTTIVIVELAAGGEAGLGYTYANKAAQPQAGADSCGDVRAIRRQLVRGTGLFG